MSSKSTYPLPARPQSATHSQTFPRNRNASSPYPNLSQNEIQNQVYLSQLIQYQSSLLEQQLSAGRESIERLGRGNGQRSVSVDARFSQSPRAFGVTLPQTYRATDYRGEEENEEEIAKRNPLVASALARRKKRQSESFEGLGDRVGESNSMAQMIENTRNLDFTEERGISPTNSNTPSLILSKPGEVYNHSSESGGSLNSDGSISSSSHIISPASSRESIGMTKREEGRKALERLGNGRPAQTRALVAALSRPRPSSLSLQNSFVESNLNNNIDSFYSALSPLASTFSPPPPISSSTPIYGNFPNSPNPYRSVSTSQHLATAIRQPFGPASESEFLIRNFSSRISSNLRKSALERLGKREKVVVEKAETA